ncbi:hypothetical protein RCL1_002741 [Eukaryota sp. TZLM3-RCL]
MVDGFLLPSPMSYLSDSAPPQRQAPTPPLPLTFSSPPILCSGPSDLSSSSPSPCPITTFSTVAPKYVKVSPFKRFFQKFSASRSSKAPSSYSDNNISTSQSSLHLLPGEEVLLSVYCDLVDKGGVIPGVLSLTNYALRLIPSSSLGEFSKIVVPLGFIESCVYSTVDLGPGNKLQVIEISTKLIATVKLHFPKGSTKNQSNPDRSRVLQLISSRIDVAQPIQCLFAFYHLYSHSSTLPISNGWNVYDPVREYTRLGLINQKSSQFRLSSVNSHYEVCKTYSSVFVVPMNLCDEEVRSVAHFRVNGRLPIAVWRHCLTNATLWRCSQPKAGLLSNKRSPADERLVACIVDSVKHGNPSPSPTPRSNSTFSSAPSDVSTDLESEPDAEFVLPDLPICTKPCLIIDCRPKTTAIAHAFMGAGTEFNSSAYEHAQLWFADIPNIHVVRDAFKKLKNLIDSELLTSSLTDVTCSSSAKNSSLNLNISNKNLDSKFYTNLDSTNWLKLVQQVLVSSLVCAHALEDSIPVIVHCTHGFDRTSQVSALAQLMLDPFYRTINGFEVLLEKEFATSGHKCATRLGFPSDTLEFTQRSPILLQFFDCCFQLLSQFPTFFEFNEQLLIDVVLMTYSGAFGTFLFDSEKERNDSLARDKTPSIWTIINNNLSKYLNSNYNPTKYSLKPRLNSMFIRFWRGLYLNSEFD